MSPEEAINHLVSQRAFFRCVEDCSETIMLSDIEGKLIYVNPAWSKVYGYTREEALGKTPGLLHSGFQNEEFYQEMWRQIKDPQKGFWKGELINRAKDGNYVPVYLTITPYRGNEGKIEGYMGIAVDMRAQKDLEAKVLHQDRLASIGLVASGLAHEIGSPLSVIRGRAELLLSIFGDNAELGKNLQIITQQIDRISYFIQSLLNIGRPTVESHLKAIDLRIIVSDLRTLLDHAFRQDNIDFLVSSQLDDLALGEEKKVQQILLNLITNALHAVKSAKLRGRADDHKVEVRLHRHGEDAVVSIIDTGVGILPHQMKKLFQPFYTTKDVGEGTGLGLPIALQIAQSFGGNISVESTPGKETKFELRLKIAPKT